MARCNRYSPHQPAGSRGSSTHVYQNPRDRAPHSTVSDASPWRLCAALYCADTGMVLAWATYGLPYEKDIVCKSQGHREYLGHLLSILLMMSYAKGRPPTPLQYFWINDNKGRCPGVGGKKQMYFTGQPIRMYGVYAMTFTWVRQYTDPELIWARLTP